MIEHQRAELQGLRMRREALVLSEPQLMLLRAVDGETEFQKLEKLLLHIQQLVLFLTLSSQFVCSETVQHCSYFLAIILPL